MGNLIRIHNKGKPRKFSEISRKKMMDIHQDKMKILVAIFSKNEKILHIKEMDLQSKCNSS